MKNYNSYLLERAINEFAKLPGIGRKTALRLVLYLLRQSTKEVENFGKAIINFRNEIHFCKICHNLCDNEFCAICTDLSRDKSLICIVENIKEVIAIENTKQYHGLYHVLGGIISPMEGIGPSNLQIQSLLERVKNNNNVKEIILALSTTMEGDTTNFYINKKLSYNTNARISLLARGISVGDEIEYTDEITLGKSIVNRIDFNENIGHKKL